MEDVIFDFNKRETMFWFYFVLFIFGNDRSVAAKGLLMWKIFEMFCLRFLFFFNSQTCLFLPGNISISPFCICPKEKVASLFHVKESPGIIQLEL